MPSLKAPLQQPQQHQYTPATDAVWTRSSSTDDVSLPQLHKFWSGLSVVARRELLRIDKQALFEQVRKNLYCSRCHGLLVEGFSQIILYGKSLQANGGKHQQQQIVENNNRLSQHTTSATTNVAAPSLQQADDSRDPSVHPWGGLAATRDSMLTVLDCFLEGMPLEVLQNVFESARARERERELLYPDACGGGGRGWICLNGGFNGRGHALKETCALHTARLSCEALVDFWSALGDETRRSLLRLKEEDFIERLMFRFNSKRFCRDCRRNVLREFKEMKELKRSRKEPQCTRWFCAADTVIRYEVSESAVQVDWQDCFVGDGGSALQRFEWALGTGEGKSDILAFEDVGLAESAYVDNLDLSSTSACFITVRGWKRDGRYIDLSAKAHALKGQLCVHRRLIVGDGYVAITKGESIQRFFERAEETEEEEDEDAIDKDGNDYEGEGTRPQKHAKSPELARDFLLDAATVIFKEQVERAFREGTARQNAHSIFVCLALSLLEERVRVACKEIKSLEKQNKLLEEEEYEKREEEERRERRKQKEKEKKLRRKEKLKSKGAGIGNNFTQATTLNSDGCLTTSPVVEDHEEERESNSGSQVEGTESNNSEDSMSARPSSPDMVEARPSADGFDSENGGSSQHETFALAQVIEDALGLRDGNGAFIVERSKSAKRRTQGSRKQQDSSNRKVVNENSTSRRQCTEPQKKSQSCACGASHRSSSSKGSGGHRGPGSRTPYQSNSRGATKPAHQKTTEATRSATRLQAAEKALKPSHSKSSSLDLTRSSPNGLENGLKPMWTPRATSNGSITTFKVAVTPPPQVKPCIQPAASSKPTSPKVETIPVVSETSEEGENTSAAVTEETDLNTFPSSSVAVATTLPAVDVPPPPLYHFLRPASFGMVPPIQQQPFGFYAWGVLPLPPPMVTPVLGHLPAIPDGLTPLDLTPEHHHLQLQQQPPQWELQRERRGSNQRDFSFFHSKWPLCEGGGEPESHPPSSCVGEKATEYSLFASAPSCNKGFGFF